MDNSVCSPAVQFFIGDPPVRIHAEMQTDELISVHKASTIEVECQTSQSGDMFGLRAAAWKTQKRNAKIVSNSCWIACSPTTIVKKGDLLLLNSGMQINDKDVPLDAITLLNTVAEVGLVDEDGDMKVVLFTEHDGWLRPAMSCWLWKEQLQGCKLR